MAEKEGEEIEKTRSRDPRLVTEVTVTVVTKI